MTIRQMEIDHGRKRTSVTMIPANGPKKIVYPLMKFKNPCALGRGVVSTESLLYENVERCRLTWLVSPKEQKPNHR